MTNLEKVDVKRARELVGIYTNALEIYVTEGSILVDRTRFTDTRDQLKALACEVERLQKLLWLRHGCDPTALYGDDGEMQCASCGLDFLRMSSDQIQDIWLNQGRTMLNGKN